MKFLGFVATFALLCGPVSGQGSSAGEYEIGPRDQVQILVDEVSTLNGEQTVAEDGTIVLPIIGVVQAQGLTEERLALRLRSRLESEGVRKATVSVTVSAYRSRPVSILGAVGKPGNHYVPGRASLMEVLLDAGGLTEGHGRSVLVRRRASNGLSDQIEIPVMDLIDLGDPEVNIPVFAGDHISVPPAGEVTVHFLGEVGQPGSMSLSGNRRLTLLAAIARAGGLLETASKKIRIKRQHPSGTPTELTVDYRALLNGREPDIELQDGDLIIVKESFF